MTDFIPIIYIFLYFKDNFCENNPCKNNGSCIQINHYTAKCECSAQFTGSLCDQPNPCFSCPCKNGATCKPVLGSHGSVSFQCQCPQNFRGFFCDINTSAACTSQLCLNGGTCCIIGDKATCVCSPFYRGSFFQT